jgi:hypothetical protein
MTEWPGDGRNEGVREGQAAGCSCLMVIVLAAIALGLLLGYCAP